MPKMLKRGIKNKRIVIFGGAGSIGSELVRQLAKQNKVYIIDINETGIFDLVEEVGTKDLWGRVGDIRNYQTVRDIFEDFKPQIVINAAAYKHVPLMEYTPSEAIQTNIIGHHNIIHISKTWECVEKFIYISTDKVNSNSIMGVTKKVGEVLTCNQGKGYLAVRFGNVLGSRGSLTTIWQRQVDAGKPITVTSPEMSRYFMTIPEAVALVIEAAEIGEGGEVITFEMGDPINIYELALEVIKRSRKEIPVHFSGVRPGESMGEEIMTTEEKKRAIKKGKFNIIK